MSEKAADSSLEKILRFSQEDLAWNRKGKVTPVQRQRLKEESSSAVRDLFYIAILFPTLLIVISSVILLVWLFLHSPELIREVAIGSLGIAFLFYLVRKVLLKDLWDSSTVLVYHWDSSQIHSVPTEEGKELYSNETKFPFHLSQELEEELKNYKRIKIYYNPTHKKILSAEEE